MTVDRRPPPQDIEAEQAVLGAVLLDPEALFKVRELIGPADFYEPRHSAIFTAALGLEALDLVSLSAALRASGDLENIGGLTYLSSLADGVPTTANVEAYAEIVADRSRRRQGIRGLRAAIEGLYDLQQDLDDAAVAAAMAVPEGGSAEHPDVEILADVARRRVDEMRRRLPGKLPGLSWGFQGLDDATGGAEPGALYILGGRPGMGKCIKHDMRVLDPRTGERVTIKDFVNQRRPCVLSLGRDWKLSNRTVAEFVDSGIKPCFRVIMRSGRRIETTITHPFLAVEGWRPLSELHPGSRVAVPRTLPVFGQANVNKDEARLLAYYVAEGGLSHNTPRFTNTDPALIGDFKAIVACMFPQCRVGLEKDGITYTVVFRKNTKNPVVEWLETYGLWGLKAKEKHIPDAVFTWPKATLAEFLQVLFSCDGGHYAIKGQSRIDFGVSSERLALDVQHLLLRFGVLSVVRHQSKTYTGANGRRFDAYRVEIASGDAVTAFEREIGWIGVKTEQSYEARGRSHSNVDHVPRAIWAEINRARQAAGLSWAELERQRTNQPNKVKGFNPHVGQRDVGRARLDEYGRLLGRPYFRTLAQSDVYWDEIKSIEYIGEHHVYDLSVLEDHNFVAEDVIVHNTGLGLEMVRRCAKVGGQPWLIVSYEMLRESLADRIITSGAMVDLRRYRRADLDAEGWAKVRRVPDSLEGLPAYVTDKTLTVPEIRHRVRVLQKRHSGRVGGVMVDYLQLIKGERRKGQSREEAVAEISRGLKLLAKDHQCAVLALSQLSRAVEKQADKRPSLADLRESGAIEQDAESVLLLYRQDYYDDLAGTPAHERKAPGIVECIVAKGRNEGTSTVKLHYRGEWARWDEVEHRREG